MSAMEPKAAVVTISSGRTGDRFDFEAYATGARSVLELGCGKAGHVPGLATRCGFGSYLGVDVDEAAISVAATRFASDRLRFARCDVLRSEWPDGTFDLVFAHDVFVLLDHAGKEEVLRRCAARLAPGGSIVVNEFNHRVLLGNAFANAFRGQLNRVAYFVGRALAILAARARGREPPRIAPYNFADEAWYEGAAARLGLSMTYRTCDKAFLADRDVRYFQRWSDSLIRQRDTVILRRTSHV